MTAEAKPKRSAVGAIVQLIVGLVLGGVVLGFSKFQDKLLDKIRWLSSLDMMSIWAAIGVIAFIAAVLWLNGYRGIARAKSRSALYGLILGLIGVVGVIISAAMPEKAIPGLVLCAIGIIGLIALLAMPAKQGAAEEQPAAEEPAPAEGSPATNAAE